MRKILFGVVVTLIVLFTFEYSRSKPKGTLIPQESPTLIQEQINNVGKLIVTEGHFSEVLTSKKKAPVVVNANLTTTYDLSNIEFEVGEQTKTLTILKILEEEIKIHPDFEYYDIQTGFLNPLEANGYNDIKNILNASLEKKIKVSNLKTSAKNSLISKLSKFYILTNSLGWALKFNDTPILENHQFQYLKL